MIDPRITIIKRRLKGITVYAIASSKGGVGKSLLSVLLSIGLRDRGLKVGLFDLDFTNPSCHILLDTDPKRHQPEEEYGIIPPMLSGLRFMSIFFYTMDRPLALRGDAIDNAIKELFAITRWEDTDILIIDTPPGISDEFIDLVTLIPNPHIVIVSTPSILSLKSIQRMIGLLKEDAHLIFGIIENMGYGGDVVKKFARENNIRYLGGIPYVNKVDDMLREGGIKLVYKNLKVYLDNILKEFYT